MPTDPVEIIRSVHADADDNITNGYIGALLIEIDQLRRRVDATAAAHARCDSAARSLVNFLNDDCDLDEDFNPPTAAAIRSHMDNLNRALLGAADPTPTAPRWAEPGSGPDAGHTWRIEITSRSSSSVTGDPGHHDAGEFTGPLRTAVRGWSLSAALSAAADLPLFCWLGFDDDAAVTTPSASPSDAKSGGCQATIFPSWSNRWIQCRSPLRNGVCAAYGHHAERYRCSCGRALPCRHCTQETNHAD